MIRKTRNEYIHGGSLEKIESIIKKIYKNQDRHSIVKIAREKLIRIALISIMLYKENKKNTGQSILSIENYMRKTTIDLFLGDTQIRTLPKKSENKLKKWFQIGNTIELGKETKYKSKGSLEVMDV